MKKKHMDRPYRPLSDAGRRRVKRRRLLGKKGKLILGVVLLWLAYLFLAGDYGLFRIISLSREIAQVEERISMLRAKKAALRREVQLLQRDPATIERVAREKLGMVKD